MAPTTRSVKLGGGVFAASAIELLYTVPAGTRTIVKLLQIYNGSGAGQSCYAFVTPATSGQNIIMLINTSTPSSTVIGGLTWFVMNAGDTLSAWSSSTSWSAYASGAELPAA